MTQSAKAVPNCFSRQRPNDRRPECGVRLKPDCYVAPVLSLSIARFSPATVANTDFGVANQKKNDTSLDSRLLHLSAFGHEVCAQ